MNNSNDDLIYQQRDEALELAKSNPGKAIASLTNLISQHPYSLAVRNLVLDDLISVASRNQDWDSALFAAQKAQNLKPQSKEFYEMEEQVLILQQQGRPLEALETRVDFHRESADSVTLMRFADEYAELDASDQAWALYNDAIVRAVQQGRSPHTVQSAMAKFLIREGKPQSAVEILFDAIDQANNLNSKGAPKSLTSELGRALKAAGIKDSSIAEQLAMDCKQNGSAHAKDLFYGML